MRPGLVSGLLFAALGASALGVLAGALATGGVLEVLSTPDEARSLAHRFGRGAFRFFGRFLRAGILAVLVGGLLAALLAGPFLAFSRRAPESGWEPATLANGAAAAAFGFLGLLVGLLALDAARVVIVRDDARRAVPAFFRGLRIVLRHPAQWLGAWAVNALLVAAALAVYVSVRGRLPAATPLVAVVVLQQAFVYTRCLLRTAMLGSGMALVERHLPRPARREASPAAGADEPEPQRSEALPVPVPAQEAAALFASAEPPAGEAAAPSAETPPVAVEPSPDDENRPR
jgi:hypothetical protein